MPPSDHEFGGDWTQEKLLRVRKYLSAFTTILSKQRKPDGSARFKYAYIDAFAGTGYRTMKNPENANELLLPELAEPEPQSLMEGSARIALQIEPRFESFIFVEKDPSRATDLEMLKQEFPEFQDKIEIKIGEANDVIKNLCKMNWINHRAVLFLDPYGMQVTWDTIEAIAKTKAIDLWYLFPLGIGLNRLLKRNGQIDESIRRKIDEILGDKDWFNAFYKATSQTNLLDNEPEFEKTADFRTIEQYFVGRLALIFPKVAQNPLSLRNSRGNPLYLLCFAAANPNAASTAVKIAQDILKN